MEVVLDKDPDKEGRAFTQEEIKKHMKISDSDKSKLNELKRALNSWSSQGIMRWENNKEGSTYTLEINKALKLIADYQLEHRRHKEMRMLQGLMVIVAILMPLLSLFVR